MKPDLNKKKWTSVAIPQRLVVEIQECLPSTSYLNVTDFVRSAVRYLLHEQQLLCLTGVTGNVTKTQETWTDFLTSVTDSVTKTQETTKDE